MQAGGFEEVGAGGGAHPDFHRGFISRYVPGAAPETSPLLARLVGHAIAYYRDFVKPGKHYRAPGDMERAALEDLLGELEALPPDADGRTIQTQVYEVGKRHPFKDLRTWRRRSTRPTTNAPTPRR